MIKFSNTIVVMKNYDQDKELSLEDRLAFESNVKKYTDLILNFRPGTGTKEINLGNGIKGIAKVGTKPESNRFIQKVNNLKSLGRYTDAVRTLFSMEKLYGPDVQLWNEF
ncbi:MAG: hypothetical protein WCJ45_06835 [bacterium]